MSGASDHDGLYIPGSSGPPERDAVESQPAKKAAWSDVPWHTIVGAVGVVVATYVVIVLLSAAVRILTWVAIAGFL
ncbi:MAG: hypothetical protein ABIZ69_11680, partial [Ilumatobacteraceae bacterium]